MKIRSGFVSNSSSSSFIIHGGDIEDISQKMLEIVIDDYSDWDKGESKSKKRDKEHLEWTKNLAKALKKKDVKSGKIGIVMPSCNYDTYLIIRDDFLYVATCNNHSWDLGAHDIEETDAHEKLKDIMDKSFFYDVRNGIVHTYEKYDMDEKVDTHCPKCKHHYGNYVFDRKGNRLCGSCFKGKLEPTPEIKMDNMRKQVGNPITALHINE